MGLRLSEYEKLLTNLGRRPKKLLEMPQQPEKQLRSFTFVVPMVPPPKARPRLSRSGGVYTPSAESEAQFAAAIDAIAPKFCIDCCCEIEIELSPDETRIQLRELPKTRKIKGDIDNVAKLVLDAVVKSGRISDDRIIKKMIISIL